MKANELMIGDWVCIDEPDKYAGATGQIQSLMNHREDDAAYFNIFIQGKFGYVLRGVCSDDIRPIPLTPEILEKNGFKEYDGLYYRLDIAEDVFVNAVFTSEEPFASVYNTHYMARPICKYLHQLQHALRLCGIDKTIEL